MDLPKPPEDPDLKNIIDKLANFVARNGPEFEQMTKQKQKDNPKFSFLFGGEYYNYYQYRVTSERARAAAEANFGEIQPPIAGNSELFVNKQKQQLAQQQVIVQQVITQQAIQSAPWQKTQQTTQQIQAIQQQIAQHQLLMDQQIKQSEQNLAAQYQSLIQQQQIQIEEAILKARDENLERLCIECDVKLEDLDNTVQPIIDSCTKDAILNGKSWIFQNCTNTEKHCDLVAYYLQKRLVQPNVSPDRICSKDAQFELRLHLIYLMNDLLHHCVRKNASELKKSLEKVVVPVFCTASTGVDEEKKHKLIKLLTLWEQNKYFDPQTIDELKNPSAALSNYQTNLITENAAVVSQITTNTQQKYASLQKQHQEFTAHLGNQLQSLQQQLQLLQQQAGPPPVETLPPGSAMPPTIPSSSAPPVVVSGGPVHQLVTTSAPIEHLAPPLVAQAVEANLVPQVIPPQVAVPCSTPPIVTSEPPPQIQGPPPQMQAPPPQIPPQPQIQPQQQPPIQPQPIQPQPPIHSQPQIQPQPQPLMQQQISVPQGQPPPRQPALQSAPQQFSQPPPGFPGPPPSFRGPPPQNFGQAGPPPGFGAPTPNQFALPDLSKPPPGFPAGPPPGFPCPLPEIDLTPSVPYYELPAGLMAPLVKLEEHEYKPLDPKDIRLPPPMPPSERLLAAVEAFYSAPTHERPRDSEGWEKLGLYEFFKAKQQAKRIRDQEKQSDRGRDSRQRSRSRSRSRSKSRSRSRSRSKERFRDREEGRRMSRSRSRSRSKSRSPSPRTRRRYNSGRRSRSRSRSESPLPYQRSSRSPSPRRQSMQRLSRSPTPPLGVNFAADSGHSMAGVPPDSKLGLDNKGHQMLMKMGWGGRGLGAAEQGIVDPIQGGDVRDRQDMFKGVGMDLKDPFEQFRKNKSHGFIARMKARDEAREKSRQKEKEED